jgi:hypothetical protein
VGSETAKVGKWTGLLTRRRVAKTAAAVAVLAVRPVAFSSFLIRFTAAGLVTRALGPLVPVRLRFSALAGLRTARLRRCGEVIRSLWLQPI